MISLIELAERDTGNPHAMNARSEIQTGAFFLSAKVMRAEVVAVGSDPPAVVVEGVETSRTLGDAILGVRKKANSWL